MQHVLSRLITLLSPALYGESEYLDDLRHKLNNNKFTDFIVISVDHEQQRNPSLPPAFSF